MLGLGVVLLLKGDMHNEVAGDCDAKDTFCRCVVPTPSPVQAHVRCQLEESRSVRALILRRR